MPTNTAWRSVYPVSGFLVSGWWCETFVSVCERVRLLSVYECGEYVTLVASWDQQFHDVGVQSVTSVVVARVCARAATDRTTHTRPFPVPGTPASLRWDECSCASLLLRERHVYRDKIHIARLSYLCQAWSASHGRQCACADFEIDSSSTLTLTYIASTKRFSARSTIRISINCGWMSVAQGKWK